MKGVEYLFAYLLARRDKMLAKRQKRGIAAQVQATI
jgi:hypothetical protein